MKYILIILALAGCSREYLERPTPLNAQTQQIVWHKAATRAEVFKICADALYISEKSNYQFVLRGCFWRDKQICHIASVDCPECFHDLGHEVKHCFDGHFHKDGVNNLNFFLAPVWRNE